MDRFERYDTTLEKFCVDDDDDVVDYDDDDDYYVDDNDVDDDDVDNDDVDDDDDDDDYYVDDDDVDDLCSFEYNLRLKIIDVKINMSLYKITDPEERRRIRG